MARQRQSDWKQVVAAYRASGLTQAAYCQQSGVQVTRLRSWLYRPEPPESAQPAFLPVTVREPFGPVELRFPSGIVVRFSVGADVEYVAALARSLAAC